MNQELELFEETIQVPKHLGVDGFMVLLRKLLVLPRLMNLNIDSRGQLSYKRYVRPGEDGRHVDVEMKTLTPSAILRNGQIDEVPEGDASSASIVVARMFQAMQDDGLYPVAFVSGTKSVFHEWHSDTCGVKFHKDLVYGLPFYRDAILEDSALFLCAAFGPGSGMVDVQKSYKAVMPEKGKVSAPPVGGFEVDVGAGKDFAKVMP